MNVRDLDKQTAKDFLEALDKICDFAEKQMHQFVGQANPGRDDIDYAFARREQAEDYLFSGAYRPLSDLWGEVTAHVARLEKGRK